MPKRNGKTVPEIVRYEDCVRDLQSKIAAVADRPPATDVAEAIVRVLALEP